MYKYHTQGYAIPAYFDWDSYTIGPYRVFSEYSYSEDYHTTVAEPNKHWLYKCMSDDDNVIACFFVNASYVCCLLKDGKYYYYDLSEGITIWASNRWSGYKDDSVPVGFEKTRYKCQSVFMPPARVLYSAKRRAINVSGKWIPVNDDIDEVGDLDVSLYSRLIHSQFEYCYKRKGGEVLWRDS